MTCTPTYYKCQHCAGEIVMASYSCGGGQSCHSVTHGDFGIEFRTDELAADAVSQNRRLRENLSAIQLTCKKSKITS